MAREIKSAKKGTVSVDGSGIQDVTDIQIAEEVDGNEYATSSTNGKKFENAAHSKESGSFNIMADQASALVAKRGTVVALIITSDGAVEMFNGFALLKTSSPSIPVQGGDNIVRTFNWAEAEQC